ncbi:hypothetical protein [Jeotgalibaca sp. A127]|uniref:hypothetical protein n=1 Tax=Jeotgalibaca sp. A127 TaxID=3457324 RepID=UPI003FD1E3DF
MQNQHYSMREFKKHALILLLSVALILFTQQIKLVKYPDATPITGTTFVGLAVLWAFSLLGIWVSKATKRTKIGFLQEFPTLGWVSIVSLVFCLASDFFVQAISAVDFLSITTPILTFAGISVADSLADLSKTSWKIAIVAVFVFSGAYVLTSLVAQLGLMLSGAL